MDFIRNRLIDEYQKRKIEKLENKHSMEYSNPATAMNAFKFRCHNCGKVGHKKWDCPDKEQSNGNKKYANVAKEGAAEEKYWL